MAVSALSLIAASTSASAHDDEGWYLRGNAGYGIHQDADLTGLIDSSFHGNGLQSEGNGAFTVGAGYDFGDHWRVELDADTLETSLGSISQTPGSQGSLLTETLMLNALYDFDAFGDRIEPYVGAGIGAVRGKGRFSAHDFPGVENELVRNPTCIGARTAGQASSCAISESDTGFGWQLLAGLGYKVTDNLTWDTHYTFLQGPDLDLSGHIANGNTGDFFIADSELSDVGAHTLVTGLRYKFGVPVKPTFTCWDGNLVFNSGQCAPEPQPVVEAAPAPVYVEPAPVVVEPTTYTCWDGSLVYDLNTCPVQQPVVQRANLNLCGQSPVAIFNVDTNATPKQMSRLGTLPEFGNSHGLSSDEFFNKLNWADAQSYMFSEETLPVGTRGLLGLGEQHHYNYSILPANEKDREAFRIQSANGSVVHFMKTCGNYMYACE